MKFILQKYLPGLGTEDKAGGLYSEHCKSRIIPPVTGNRGMKRPSSTVFCSRTSHRSPLGWLAFRSSYFDSLSGHWNLWGFCWGSPQDPQGTTPQRPLPISRVQPLPAGHLFFLWGEGWRGPCDRLLCGACPENSRLLGWEDTSGRGWNCGRTRC